MILSILRFAFVMFLFGLLLDYLFDRDVTILYAALRALVVSSIYMIIVYGYDHLKYKKDLKTDRTQIKKG